MKVIISDKVIKKLTEECCAEIAADSYESYYEFYKYNLTQRNRMKKAVERQIKSLIKNYILTTDCLLEYRHENWWPKIKFKP